MLRRRSLGYHKATHISRTWFSGGASQRASRKRGAFELRTTCKALINSKNFQMPSGFPACRTQEVGYYGLESLGYIKVTSKGQAWGWDVLRLQPRLGL